MKNNELFEFFCRREGVCKLRSYINATLEKVIYFLLVFKNLLIINKKLILLMMLIITLITLVIIEMELVTICAMPVDYTIK